MPKKKCELRPGTCRIPIHLPVATADLSPRDRAVLAGRVQEIVASALPPEKRGSPESGEKVLAQAPGDERAL